MDKIEQVPQEFYAVLVKLYPRQFRQEFENEMKAVFGDALDAARRSGLWAVLRLCSREMSELPGALLLEYKEAKREKEMELSKNNQFTTGREDADPVSGHGWGEIFLAVLPFLLILLIDALPKLLVATGQLTWEAPAMRVVNTGLGLLLIVTLLVIIFVGWRQRWPVWSASWYPFFVLGLLWMVIWLVALLTGSERFEDVSSQGWILYLAFPLIIAVLLYAVTRLDRLRGLLAALPVLYLLWLPNMEFVPDSLEFSIKATSTALICLAIAFLLHRGDWRLGLYAVLAANLVVGFLYSYASIYHGGYLPFSAPGPSLVEVIKRLIPQYLATSAILLGPLFAMKFRQLRFASARNGKTGYRLALSGLMLVILSNLGGLMMYESPPPYTLYPFFNRSVLVAEIWLGMGIYMVGLVLLYRSLQMGKAASRWVERTLLVMLPLALPIALMLPFIEYTAPVSSLYGYPLLWELPRALTLSLGLVWLVLSIWLVTRESEHSIPHSSTIEVTGATSLS
jgi:hypothetical protein